jgi:hypothetical protein
MSDPLSLIRAATMAGEKLVSKDGSYSFGGIELPEGTSTSFRRTLKGESPEGARDTRDFTGAIQSAKPDRS